MSDELRDRIAATLDRNFNPDQYPIMAAMFRDYAQAIIDDLGLTPTENSRHNQMIQYETKWLPREKQ
ncbi:hypothetical protein [Brevibacterium sediminis]